MHTITLVGRVIDLSQIQTPREMSPYLTKVLGANPQYALFGKPVNCLQNGTEFSNLIHWPIPAKPSYQLNTIRR